MENTPCPLCGSGDCADLWERGGARYVRCTGCSLVYENPRFTAEELKEFYSSESYYVRSGGATEATSGYADYFAQCSPAILEDYFSLLRRIAPAAGPVRFLDVGCGPGGLVDVARRAGWEATGLELSSWSVEQGRQRGLQIVEGTLEQAAFPGGSFDVISLFDVLEHLPRPVEYVRELHRILKPGGAVLVETPNVEGFFVRRLYRERSDMVKPRAHICLYGPRTARRLFPVPPFAEVQVETFPWCRRHTPGYVKSVLLSRLIPGRPPVQLTWDESMRIVARKGARA